MSNTVKQDITGKITAKARDGKDYHLNPKERSRTESQTRTRGTSTTVSKFKLVTVRRLTSASLDAVKEQLERQQLLLEQTAVGNNQPPPFPARIPASEDDLKQTYGVYVDEDLYGKGSPVYIFTSASSYVKAFITANGTGKEDYSVHIGHLVEKIDNKDKTYTTTWRLVTIDKNLYGTSAYHILESQSTELPSCFSYNFSMDSIHYIGGGCWTSMAVDPKDRIPVIEKVQGNVSRYIPLSPRRKIPWLTKCIVAYSFTPSYTFTWCRGELKVNKRIREASHLTDLAFLKSEGVMKVTRQHSYSLDITQRPTNPGISEVIYPEFSKGQAIYVSNTNAPEIDGPNQFPDFGTDVRRLAIQSYEQTTNIIRPSTFTYTLNLLNNRPVNQFNCFNPVLCSSNNMATYIRLNIGEGRGNINHGFETKIERGERGFDYGEFYKLWWCPGKIVSFYPTNDGMIYKRSKTAEARGEPSLFPTGETLYDRGKLQISEYPNATETTWPSLLNPQTGFFGLKEGKATWNMEYDNPPLLGHEAVYYYHKNPVLPDIDDTISKTDIPGLDQQNTLRSIFGQMQGGLGGSTTVSLNIGRFRKAVAANDSIVVLAPSPTQLAEIRTVPEKFPGGFWEAIVHDLSYSNENVGTFISYDSKGNIVSQETR
jgi:hypothetical protein